VTAVQFLRCRDLGPIIGTQSVGKHGSHTDITVRHGLGDDETTTVIPGIHAQMLVCVPMPGKAVLC